MYGLRFHYGGQTFKASEFGLRSLFGQHGQRLKGQKGKSKVPLYVPAVQSLQAEIVQSRASSSSLDEYTHSYIPHQQEEGFLESLLYAANAGASEDEFYNELEAKKRKKPKFKR